MKIRLSAGRRIFLVCNYILLGLVALICIMPIVNVLSISLSNSGAAAANQVKLWPVGFTLESYRHILRKNEFLNAFGISLLRVALGVPINILFTVLTAYPLSKDKNKFRARTFFSFYFVATMLFSGGLIPWYMTIRYTKILYTIWALVIPGAVPVFNVIVVMNFFRALPKELEESAFIDGAGHWRTLGKIFLPLSLPSLATITLFATVGHWNSWFDGIVLMKSPASYPLQSYLQTIAVKFDAELISKMTTDELMRISEISNRTTKAAQVFVAALPILLVYPFLQRYFMSGLVMGSVKG